MNSSPKFDLLQLYSLPQMVFTLHEIAMMMGVIDTRTLAARLNYQVRNKRLLNPRRGIYAKPDYKMEELACVLYKPSYLSLEYVLQRTGVVFQYDTTFTMVSYLNRHIEVDNQNIQYHQIKGEILSDTRGIERRQNMNIAIPERALLDIMYLNSEYYFDNIRPLNINIIKELLTIYNSNRLAQRVDNLFKKEKVWK